MGMSLYSLQQQTTTCKGHYAMMEIFNQKVKKVQL
jgi:hypothetical protein